jgi:hypothetical protein
MAYGPVQYFVFVFPGNEFKGEIIPALQDVISKGMIRVVDIVFAMKDEAGNLLAFEIDETKHESAKQFSSVVDTVSGLLSEEDIQTLAQGIPANSAAALLVFEHVWAKDLADAIRNANGQVVAQGYVPHDIVEEVARSRAEAAAA